MLKYPKIPHTPHHLEGLKDKMEVDQGDKYVIMTMPCKYSVSLNCDMLLQAISPFLTMFSTAIYL